MASEKRLASKKDSTLAFREWVAVFAAFAAVSIGSSLYQERITLHQGRGSDGAAYFGVAAQLSIPVRPEARAPFVYRLGTPLLVSWLPGPVRLGQFEAVNLAGGLLATGLLVFWLRHSILDWKVRFALVVLFVTQWHGPIRYAHYYPATVEPWGHVFLLAGLLCLNRMRAQRTFATVAGLTLVCAVGVVFREAVLLVALAALLLGNPIRAWDRGNGPRLRAVDAIAALAAGAVLVAVHTVAIATNEYAFSSQVLRLIETNASWRYLLAWFVAFGPILVTLLYGWRSLGRYLIRRQELLAFLLGVGMLAYIGGSDTERFLYWSAPVIYLLVGMSVERLRPLAATAWWALLVASQTISQRWFWTVPDFPGDERSSGFVLLTPWSSDVPYRDVLAFASRDVAVESLAQYGLLTVGLLAWLWVRERRSRARSVAPS